MNEICSLEKNMAFLDIDSAVNPVGRLTQPDHDRAISMPARLENMELYPFVRSEITPLLLPTVARGFAGGRSALGRR